MQLFIYCRMAAVNAVLNTVESVYTSGQKCKICFLLIIIWTFNSNFEQLYFISQKQVFFDFHKNLKSVKIQNLQLKSEEHLSDHLPGL